MAVPGLNAAQVNPYASHSRTGNRVVFTCTGSHRVRITVYKPEMARIEFSSNGDFLDGESGFYLLRASFNEKTYPAVTFSVTDQGTYVAIQTSSMTIRVQKNPLRVQYYDATNTTLITKDSDARGMDTENPRLRLVRNVGEHFFGWGGGRDIMQGNLPAQLDKTGLRIGQNLTTNFDIKWCNDAPFLFSTDGYAVFFLNTEHPYSGVAGVDISQPGQVDYIGDYADVGTILRYYFFYGPYARCIDNYTELTGRPAKLTKKFYGIHHVWWGGTNVSWPWSTYTTWADNWRTHQFPCDVVCLDIMYQWGRIGYSQGDGNPYGLGNPDSGLVSMFQHFKQRGFIVGGQVRGFGIPGCFPDPPGNITLDANPYASVAVDRGFDFAWYDRCWWNDYHMDEDSRNVWRQAHRGDDSMVWVRYGWFTQSAQAFPASHQGDYITASGAWRIVPGMIDRAIVGYHIDGTDLGSDLWNVIGTSFWPVVSFHKAGAAGTGNGGHDDGSAENPWTLSLDAQNLWRKWNNFHYQLIPYLFSYGTKAHYTGMPVIRHMFMMDEKNPETYNKDRQCYVGDWLLASPYYPDGPGDAGTGIRNGIWLPAGEWYDWWTGTKYTGPTTINYNCNPTGTLDGRRLPLFVKAGGIVPMMPQMLYVGNIPEDPITVGIWPFGTTSFDLYEDTRPVVTTITSAHTPGTQTVVTFSAFPGSIYSPPSRKYVIELYCSTAQPQSVSRDGTALARHTTKAAFDSATAGWYYDASVRGGTCFCKPNGNAQAGFSVTFTYGAAGAPAKILCSATPAVIPADGMAITTVTARVCDANDLTVSTAVAVTFSVSGGGTLVGDNPVISAAGMATIRYQAGAVPGTATVTASATGLTPGTVAIKQNSLPAVVMTAPVAGSTYTAPATITLAATASDTDGSVQRVEFYRNSSLLYTDTTSPYSYSWTGVSSGTYLLSVRATDSDNGTSSGTAVSVTVYPANQPPVVTLVSPVTGSTYTAPAAITLIAQATDADGSVTLVRFYQGSTQLATVSASPYRYEWSSVGPGVYQLRAVAQDNAGAVSTSAAVLVTVNVATNSAPTVYITTPTSGAVFPYLSTITIQAAASDTDGSVVVVEFYQGTTLLGADSASPYQYTWAIVSSGTYSLTAWATDNGGAVAISSAVTITVRAQNSPPATVITNPPGGARYTAPASIVIVAPTTDSDGQVLRVEFFANGVQLGSDPPPVRVHVVGCCNRHLHTGCIGRR